MVLNFFLRHFIKCVNLIHKNIYGVCISFIFIYINTHLNVLVFTVAAENLLSPKRLAVEITALP